VQGELDRIRIECLLVGAANLSCRMFAANSASSERSPFCNSMCAAMAWSLKRLTT
jgi:hypothetical protein